jgi:hypothetical protein
MTTRPKRASWLVYVVLGCTLLLVALLWLQRSKPSSARREDHAAQAHARLDEALRLHVETGAGTNHQPILTGVVSDEAGKAIAKATVCSSCTACDRSLPGSAPTCTTSRDDGTYVIERLRGGSFVVSASALEHMTALGDGGRPIVVHGEDTKPFKVDVKLARGGATVAGVVMDTTGGPVVGATVQAVFKTSSELSSPLLMQNTTTDEQGRFSLGCAPGHVLLIAKAEGYAPGETTRSAPSTGVELVVTPASSIRGRVQTEEGEPVAGVSVFAQAGASRQLPQGTSDDSGKFEITGLSPGIYRLRGSGEGWLGEHAETVLLDLAEIAEGVVLVVRPAATIRGKLVDNAGKPCAEGHVQLGPRREDYSLPVLNAVANLEGEASFEAVPPGTYQLAAGCFGYDPQFVQMLEVKDQDLSNLEWRFDRGLEIAGTVVDRSGSPLLGVTLDIKEAQGRANPTSFTTDEKGAFTFRGLRPGSYELQAPEFAKPVGVELSERADATHLRLVAETVGRIRVRVVDAQGQPIDGLAVYAMLPRAVPSNPGQALGRGLYEVGPLEEGSYATYVDDGVNPLVRIGGPASQLAVRAGATTQADVTLGRREGKIAGVVRDDSGAPVPNVWVQALPSSVAQDVKTEMRQMQSNEPPKRSLSNDDGTFELTGLVDKGTFDVVAERPLGGKAKSESVTTGASVELVLEALGSIAGTAVDADGKPIDHLMVQITNTRTGQRRNEVLYDPTGKWRLESVTPGPVQIAAADRHRSLAIIDVELAPKQQLDGIKLELRAAKPLPAAAPAPPGVVTSQAP